MFTRLIAALVAAFVFLPAANAQMAQEHKEMLYVVTLVRAADGTGSGTVIYSAKRGNEWHSYVLTNHHVVAGSIKVAKEWDPKAGKEVDKERREQVRVEWWDYNLSSRAVGTKGKTADIAAYDRQADLALLRLVDREAGVEPVAHLQPPSAPLYAFEPVWSVGAGLGKPPFPTSGLLANQDQMIDGYRYLLGTAPIIFGNSGGAMFHKGPKRYELIGVPSRVSGAGFGVAVTHMAWAIPMETVYAFLKAHDLAFIVPEGGQ